MSNLRLFIAIYPPEAVVARLREVVGAMTLPEHRLVPEDQVHLTLQFIGDRPATKLEETVESVRRSAAGLAGFSLAVTGLIHLPQRGQARLVAATTDAPHPLPELKRRLVTRLAHSPKKDRPFRPHLTLLRFRDRSTRVSVDQPIDEGLSFAVHHIALMRSTLSPQGASHRVLATIDLA